MCKKLPSGFTLVELLVTVSLIGILFTIGIASYIDFNRRQLVSQSARKLVEDLRLAQSMADNNQKPSDCETLDGYTFSIPGSTYTIDVNCSGQSPVTVKTDTIPSNLTILGFSWVKFKVLRQTLGCSSDPNPCNLTLTDPGSGNSQVITVGAGGVIKIEGE